MGIGSLLFDVAKASGLAGMAATYGVGWLLRRKLDATNVLVQQAGAGERAKQILIKSGVYAEDPAKMKYDKNVAEAKAVRDFLLSVIVIDGDNVSIDDVSIAFCGQFAHKYNFVMQKVFNGNQLPLNKEAFRLFKLQDNKKTGEKEVIFIRKFIPVKILNEDGSFRFNLTIK